MIQLWIVLYIEACYALIVYFMNDENRNEELEVFKHLSSEERGFVLFLAPLIIPFSIVIALMDFLDNNK